MCRFPGHLRRSSDNRASVNSARPLPPLSAEERAPLADNLQRDGCRDPLVVWEPEGDGGPQVLLDGHNRLGLCRQHDLPFRTVVIPLASRDEAVNWVITNQLGRRNLTPEQKSYLRGRRYNREKRQGERTDLTSPENQEKSVTAERLAAEYSVSRDTIERDGQFADAADTLEDEVRHDLRQAVLRRKSREDKTRTTKQQVTRAGRAIKERRVEPLPFMRRAEWKDHQVIEAIDLIAEARLSADEQQALVCALSR